MVLAHGHYIMGPKVAELEERLAVTSGAPHCVTCANGTDALLLALLGHEIGPGDAVFTTPLTFFATAEVIVHSGATPVFVDVDPTTYNLDVDALQGAVTDLKAGRPRRVLRGISFPVRSSRSSSTVCPPTIAPSTLWPTSRAWR